MTDAGSVKAEPLVGTKITLTVTSSRYQNVGSSFYISTSDTSDAQLNELRLIKMGLAEVCYHILKKLEDLSDEATKMMMLEENRGKDFARSVFDEISNMR